MSARHHSSLLVCAALLCATARAQVFTQQASRLVGNGASVAETAGAVALSADGNTALIGAPSDNNQIGAVWVFTRDNNGSWSQQGKLVGSGNLGPADQGASVALSADGNTALIGGPNDNSKLGAVWVFTRDNHGNWSQQGSKLVGSGAIGQSEQGTSVSLSADGSTAAEGGADDEGFAGAVWVFTRDSNSNWSQQGSKLVGGDPVGPATQGWSVSLSADGNTALEGGQSDDDHAGAAWIFTRDSDGNWTQQGSKLVGSRALGRADQGTSVSLSADGNTALVGGPGDNNQVGATWLFTRDGSGNWTQQGSKLIGVDAVGAANQGWSVALSGDGNTALAGGWYDNSGTGAAWVFTRDSNGNWSQLGSKLVGSVTLGPAAQGQYVAISANGNTAIEGSAFDVRNGGAWVFVRVPSFFSAVPGALTQISVGVDGSVWGINNAQQIFTYNYATESWTNIPGALVQIAVGSSTAVWGLNAQRQIYNWDSVYSNWINIPGSLRQIAVGSDGDAWGLNAQSSIYHYNPQTGFFNQVPGQLSQIAVGSAGSVYGINEGQAFWYNPGTGSFQYVPGPPLSQIAAGADGLAIGASNGLVYAYENGAWTPLPTNVPIAQVALGTGASIYGLDSAANIYFMNPQTQAWIQIPGTLSSIAVAGNGTVWGLNSSQQIFTLSGGSRRAYQTLTSVAGSLNQIAVGADGSAWGILGNTVETFNPVAQSFQTVPAPALAQISAGARGYVWGVDNSGNIYQYVASSQTWNNVPGELNFIQVGADGAVWGINAASQIFTYNFSNNSWSNIPGALQTLSVGADGTVWGINAQQQIYRFNPAAQSWVNVPGSLVQISVGSATNIWGVNAFEQVYRYDPITQSWVNIPGAALVKLRVSFDGSVWGVNATGNLYQWSSTTQSFNFAGSAVTDVSIGNAAAVWALNTTSAAIFSWF